MTKPTTNVEIAREFCRESVQRTFGLTNERTEEYAKVIAELLDFACAEMKERCAQVAKAAKERAIEEYRQRIKENDASADYYLWCRDEADAIESAIRALKDKP